MCNNQIKVSPMSITSCSHHLFMVTFKTVLSGDFGIYNALMLIIATLSHNNTRIYCTYVIVMLNHLTNPESSLPGFFGLGWFFCQFVCFCNHYTVFLEGQLFMFAYEHGGSVSVFLCLPYCRHRSRVTPVDYWALSASFHPTQCRSLV